MTQTKKQVQADAMAWAERFVEYAERNPGLALDEGAMAGWFANAIEAAELPSVPLPLPMQYEPTPRRRKHVSRKASDLVVGDAIGDGTTVEESRADIQDGYTWLRVRRADGKTTFRLWRNGTQIRMAR